LHAHEGGNLMEKMTSADMGMSSVMDKMGPPAEEASSGSDELEMHAKTFINATKRGDAKAVATAFRAMKQACESEGYDDATDDNFG
jgi:hypothetical protein